ncbi:hypothetical protein TKK_0016622 [Trichogramma kaykai]
MDVIVEIQGFRLDQNFIPKEVCITSVQALSYSHWIIESPKPFVELTVAEQVSVQDFSSMHLGIHWCEGYLTPEKSEELIRMYTASAVNVYMYADDQCKLDCLEKLLNRRVLDLQLFLCPSPEAKEGILDTLVYCGLHRQKLINGQSQVLCCMRRITALRQWMCTIAAPYISSEYMYGALLGYSEITSPAVIVHSMSTIITDSNLDLNYIQQISCEFAANGNVIPEDLNSNSSPVENMQSMTSTISIGSTDLNYARLLCELAANVNVIPENLNSNSSVNSDVSMNEVSLQRTPPPSYSSIFGEYSGTAVYESGSSEEDCHSC